MALTKYTTKFGCWTAERRPRRPMQTDEPEGDAGAEHHDAEQLQDHHHPRGGAQGAVVAAQYQGAAKPGSQRPGESQQGNEPAGNFSNRRKQNVEGGGKNLRRRHAVDERKMPDAGSRQGYRGKNSESFPPDQRQGGNAESPSPEQLQSEQRGSFPAFRNGDQERLRAANRRRLFRDLRVGAQFGLSGFNLLNHAHLNCACRPGYPDHGPHSVL